jgi:hypothetical protein
VQVTVAYHMGWGFVVPSWRRDRLAVLCQLESLLIWQRNSPRYREVNFTKYNIFLNFDSRPLDLTFELKLFFPISIFLPIVNKQNKTRLIFTNNFWILCKAVKYCFVLKAAAIKIIQNVNTTVKQVVNVVFKNQKPQRSTNDSVFNFGFVIFSNIEIS